MKSNRKFIALALGLFLFCTGALAQVTTQQPGAAKKKSQPINVQKTKKKSQATKPSWIRLVSPKGGEELVAGTDLNIQWESQKRGGQVAITLVVENPLTASASYFTSHQGLVSSKGVAPIKVPVTLTTNAPDTGSFKYRIPYLFNSRFGYRFKIVIQKGNFKDESGGYFTIYPKVDLTAMNIKIKNKNKRTWGLKTLTTILTGGAAQLPGWAEASLIKETVNWSKKDKKPISAKKDIIVEFDVISRGIDILTQPLMSKVAVRLHPGGAELNAGGFSHSKIVPGRKYHQKATIKPRDWDIAPGSYRLEIIVDPQNNANEPEALRANNTKTIQFQVR
ncbi:MAG: hypothetical protein QNJ97_05150 [Myxococcota bacterium]|nr:hypothetical protein [Myxococcota bacterium]